jgi:hypothetical protein
MVNMLDNAFKLDKSNWCFNYDDNLHIGRHKHVLPYLDYYTHPFLLSLQKEITLPLREISLLTFILPHA